MQGNPMTTMNDITALSAGEEIEKVNTMQVSKGVELRSRVIVSILAGFVLGVLLCIIAAQFIPLQFAVFLILIGTVAVPFFVTGTVNDATQQVRWKRAMQELESRDIEGEVFYVNSSHPENITDLHELIIR